MAFNASVPLIDHFLDDPAQVFNTRYALFFLVNIPILAVVFNVLRQMLPQDRSRPPVVFHWFPFIGSSVQYGSDPLEFLFACQEKYGDVFTFILLGRRVTVALGAKGNNFVLGGKSTVFNAEDAYKHMTSPVFGDDVVYAIPNHQFMEQKKFIKFGLSTESFRTYVGMFEDEVETYLSNEPVFKSYQDPKRAGEWGSFDPCQVIAEITILTASRTLQGKQIRAALDKSFAELIADLDGGFTPMNFFFPNLPLEHYRRRDRAHRKISDFYIDIVKQRKAKGDDQELDMIAALSGQVYRSGKPMTDSEVAHCMIALLMAGQHTSASTGAWAVLRLADDPDFAEKIYQEQVKFFGTPDRKLRPMTYDEARELPLMNTLIRETLRLHPPIHTIMRHVREDVPVPPSLAAPSKDGVYVVPKGDYVLASPTVSHTDPRVWRNAMKFDPYRWIDPEGMAAQALETYVDEHGEKIDYGFGAVSKGTESPYQPFGAGRHRCVGEQFAYLQVGTILATLVRELEFRLPKPFPANNYYTMIPTPQTPRNVEYRRRRRN
ncbi:lanosterol 14-alpha-demethylase [Desarmillaria tabescens]|uniref:Lanosterol 14-alpha-demethylase n=1 Tax=Armillaria tabescens TaxID=1929756 RepID=A0AA39NPB0_ARMTA|nr:lanosterol 14-alpha-demethylase [Desarmillaria tabescens]KAK0469342.1 lanosterol 14-alpha-demethylase [Desarmillaria tabescens]